MIRRIARRLRALLKLSATVADLEMRLEMIEERIESPRGKLVGGRGRDTSRPEPCDDCGPDDEDLQNPGPLVQAMAERIGPVAYLTPEKRQLWAMAAQRGLMAPRGFRRAPQ